MWKAIQLTPESCLMKLQSACRRLSILRYREYTKAEHETSQCPYSAYKTKTSLRVNPLGILHKRVCRSSHTRNDSSLSGNLNFDLVSICFGNLRICVLHNLLGLFISLLQKIALSGLIGCRLLGILQGRCSIRYFGIIK